MNRERRAIRLRSIKPEWRAIRLFKESRVAVVDSRKGRLLIDEVAGDFRFSLLDGP